MAKDRADLLQRALAADPTDETAHRILGAAAEQAEDFGLRRFTIDEVARRVGLSRVTVYRHFPKKDQLITALLLRELRRFLTQLDAVVEAHPTPEAKLTEGLLFCLNYLRGHRLLSRLLRTEPELILPHLTTKGAPVISAARGWIARLIRNEIIQGRVVSLPDDDVEVIAEILVRIVISLVISPDTALPVESPDAQRRLAQRYLDPVVAALRPPKGQPEQPQN